MATARDRRPPADADRERAHPLSREEIVEAAVRLTRRVGLDQLTMRALADELNVTPMATYYHVPNKERLLELVADAVISEIPDPGPEHGGWESRLVFLHQETRRKLMDYPGLANYVLNRGLTPAGRRLTQAMRRALVEAGFGDRTAALAASTFYTYGYGQIVLESRVRSQRRDDRPRGSRADAVIDVESDEAVEFGLSAVIAGLRAMLHAET